MSFTITIPDDFAEVLGSTTEERDRRAREALALELYREGKISLRRMGELAGVGGDYWAAENFRSVHKAPLNYSIEDLESDRQAAERYWAKELAQPLTPSKPEQGIRTTDWH